MLDIAAPEFRAPVFWRDNPGGDDYWVMAVARPLAREAEFHRSDDLKDWGYMSSFGSGGAVGGIWEAPDRIEMTVENTGETKCLLAQNLNPGGIAGGSAARCFVGDGDGVTFTPDALPTPCGPDDAVWEDFETGFGRWTVTGAAFGTGPAPGALGPQSPGVGFEARGLVDSFRDGAGNPGDAGTGRMLSDAFVIGKDFIDFRIGGGHRLDLGAAVDPGAPGGRDHRRLQAGPARGLDRRRGFRDARPRGHGPRQRPGRARGLGRGGAAQHLQRARRRLRRADGDAHLARRSKSIAPQAGRAGSTPRPMKASPA